jgi:hypothetical protein
MRFIFVYSLFKNIQSNQKENTTEKEEKNCVACKTLLKKKKKNK